MFRFWCWIDHHCLWSVLRKLDFWAGHVGGWLTGKDSIIGSQADEFPSVSFAILILRHCTPHMKVSLRRLLSVELVPLEWLWIIFLQANFGGVPITCLTDKEAEKSGWFKYHRFVYKWWVLQVKLVKYRLQLYTVNRFTKLTMHIQKRGN